MEFTDIESGWYKKCISSSLMVQKTVMLHTLLEWSTESKKLLSSQTLETF